MTINLTAPLDLPENFVERLGSIDVLCSELESSEELVKQPRVVDLVRDINIYCESNRILGFHYTRANPDLIREHGLLIRTGDEIRAQFLKEYSQHFNDIEMSELKSAWEHYFSEHHRNARDSRIFFNFTLSELDGGGTKYLLGMYGGEQITMCFEFDSDIGKKLASIGEPLVVSCSLDPGNVRTNISQPWGKIMVSSYHKLVNSDAYTIDQDGNQKVPVFPEEIVEVKTLTIASIRAALVSIPE